jgi:Tfp pilus assembly protein PilO
MKSFLLQLNNKTLRNVGVMFLGAITIMGLLLSVTPILKAARERNDVTTQLQTELGQTTARINEYSAMKGKRNQLDATSQYLMGQFPETSAVPGLLTDVNSAAMQAGMSPSLINNVSVGAPTQIVVPVGLDGNAVCSSMAPGEFAKIVPDLKNSNATSQAYIMCTESPISNLTDRSFYNAATPIAARQCAFNVDAGAGTLFYIKVTCTGTGAILPALATSSVNVDGQNGRFPARPVLAQVTGQAAQIPITISLASSVKIQTLAAFINKLYGMGRTITISSIKVGMSMDANGVSYTVISGFVYSHTAIISGETIAKVSGLDN